jgi:exonuclease III
MQKKIIIILISILCIQVNAEPICRTIFAKQSKNHSRTYYRFMSYNVLNLFLHSGKFSWYEEGLVPASGNKLPPEKELKHTQGVAKAILETNPDFLFLQEVEGIDSIKRFNSDFLNSKYDIYLPKTNDQRGIGIAFLVRSSLDLEISFESNEHHKWHDHANNNRYSAVFTRSFPVFKIFKKGNQYPSLILAGVHFKSRRDRKKDPKSFFKRSAEINKATDILSEIRNSHEGSPLIVMGDFNSARGQQEVEYMRNALRLIDTHASLLHFEDPHGMGLSTHTYHPESEVAVGGALDMALISMDLVESLGQSSIYRYKDDQGKVKKLPMTREERDQNPSDHYPIYFDLNSSIFDN